MDSSQVAQSQPQFGEDVVIGAPLVNDEAVQDKGFNSGGVMHVEVSWIIVG
jgi:hypothetical protein